jgi:hypothetical protein
MKKLLICDCKQTFSSELAFKIHITRKCDNGRYLGIIKNERMISKPILLFIDDLFIDLAATSLTDNSCRYEKILYNALVNIKSSETPYYIRCEKYTYVKGWLNTILFEDKEKEKDSLNVVDYNWSRVDTKDFINMFVERLNNLINKRIIEKKLVNCKNIEVEYFRAFYHYFKKISK